MPKGGWRPVSRPSTIAPGSTLRAAGVLVLAVVVLTLGVDLVAPRHVPGGILLYGAVTGSIYSLLATGFVLVYRANRIINFALAEIGVFGAVLFENLVRASGWPWLAAAIVGLLTSALLALALERRIAQRFFTAPRLILSVVTIGMAQIVAFGEFLITQGFGTFGAQAGLHTPLSNFRFSVTCLVFDGNAVLLLGAVPL